MVDLLEGSFASSIPVPCARVLSDLLVVLCGHRANEVTMDEVVLETIVDWATARFLNR